MLQRIEERRNINFVGLLKFLNNLFRYNHELNINSKLILPSIYALKSAAKKYFIRLFIKDAGISLANIGIFNESHDNENHDNESKISSISQPVARTLLCKSWMLLFVMSNE